MPDCISNLYVDFINSDICIVSTFCCLRHQWCHVPACASWSGVRHDGASGAVVACALRCTPACVHAPVGLLHGAGGWSAAVWCSGRQCYSTSVKVSVACVTVRTAGAITVTVCYYLLYIIVN